MTDSPRADAGRRNGLVLACILLLTFLAGSPSLLGDFTGDDRYVALGVNDFGHPNRRIFEVRSPGEYFGTHYWADTFDSGRLYRPLTVFSFAVRHALFGDRAWPAYLANLLLHVAATWLVFRLLIRVASRRASWIGAALFGLHAVHAEVVATVVGRAELLVFVLGAAALELWITTGTRRLAANVGSAAMLFLALCSKESAIAWPVLFVAYACATGIGSVRAVSLRVAALAAAPIAVFLVLRGIALASLSEFEPTPYLNNPLFEAPLASRLVEATKVLGHGLWLCAAPLRLVSDYGAEVFALDGADSSFFATTLVIVALVVVAVLSRKSRPAFAVGVAGFFGFALVTSNHLLPIGTIFAERLLYLPSIGCAFVVASAFDGLRGRLAHVFLAGFVAWAAVSTYSGIVRCLEWKSDASIYECDLARQPRSIRLRVGWAGILRGRGDLQGAERELRETIRIAPELTLPRQSLAEFLLSSERYDEAVETSRRGLAVKHGGGADGEGLLRAYLGIALNRLRRPREALPELFAALRLQPQQFAVFNEIYFLRANGKTDEQAILEFLRRCEQERPERPHWRAYRGILAHHEGRWKEAVPALRQALPALALAPQTYELLGHARFSLGHSLVELGDEAAVPVLRSVRDDPFVVPLLQSEAKKQLERLRSR